MGDNSGEDPPRRTVRPNFAEDVYGDKKTSSSESENECAEFSESSLAHRRQVSLLKLKQPPAGANCVSDLPSNGMLDNYDISDHYLDFTYTECDTLQAELAELYSYSELDDFASNLQCWKAYADEKQLDPPHFSCLAESRKRIIVTDICNRMESAEADVRLSNARALLYLLQGAYADFGEEEELEAGIPTKAPTERGTGEFEAECVRQAFLNAHLAFACGAYQSLCSLLLSELVEPFEGGISMDGRCSKASSRDSRHASNADLSDGRRRAATMADNESLRIVLAAIYHMVELIRNRDLTETEGGALSMQRLDFLAELEEPLDHHGKPLLYVLFELMPPFYTGTSPHLPMKKILLLIWKTLLAVLGGAEELDERKRRRRLDNGLECMENTIKVAQTMAATVINDGETGVRMAAKRSGGSSRLGTLALARQLACAGSDEQKDEDDMGNDAVSGDASNEPKEPVSTPLPQQQRDRGQERQVSGDRTPRAGSPMPFEPPRKELKWRGKIGKTELEAYIQQERQKFFSYNLPGDSTTLFGLPPPIQSSIGILRKHVYTSLAEIQAEQDEDFNRYLFSRKESIEKNSTEELYELLLPNLSQYIVALLKVLLAAAPSNKAKSDALNILVDVLTPETDGSDVLSNSISLDHSSSCPLEESVRLAIDINRHKEIMVKATSSILILLCKHFKLNHVYQFEYLCQHVVFGNGIPLLLKFLDQNMTRYVQSRYEIHAYNYPQSVLYYVRNREEWPVLNSENVEDCPSIQRTGVYYMWRNVFSAINIVRVLNKLVKGKQSRVMMLMVFKSAPILKRSLKIRLGIFQLYILKALKMQSRYLGRQWRRTNMDIMSAIYNKVRHRLTDDWAFANEMRKPYDYQNEESELKAAVERFHSRRYARRYPQFAIEVNDAAMPGDDYLNRVDIRDFEPVDSCAHSVLGGDSDTQLGHRFKKDYEKWMKREVLSREVDWEKLLMNTRGIFENIVSESVA